jgi:hypothetical protein
MNLQFGIEGSTNACFYFTVMILPLKMMYGNVPRLGKDSTFCNMFLLMLNDDLLLLSFFSLSFFPYRNSIM